MRMGIVLRHDINPFSSPNHNFVESQHDENTMSKMLRVPRIVRIHVADCLVVIILREQLLGFFVNPIFPRLAVIMNEVFLFEISWAFGV